MVSAVRTAERSPARLMAGFSHGRAAAWRSHTRTGDGDAAAAEPVNVWLTTGDRSQLLQAQPSLQFGADQARRARHRRQRAAPLPADGRFWRRDDRLVRLADRECHDGRSARRADAPALLRLGRHRHELRAGADRLERPCPQPLHVRRHVLRPVRFLARARRGVRHPGPPAGEGSEPGAQAHGVGVERAGLDEVAGAG